MTELFKIYTWIDREMKFDKWYKIESEEQKQIIQQIMDSELIPDCEFNLDYSSFRKSQLAYDLQFKESNPIILSR